MSNLLLVRHGQARAFEADSDRLTDLGEQQARRLGAYLASLGGTLDVALSGTLERHRRTAALAAEAYGEAGRSFPEVTQDARWNEYDAPGILGTLLPALSERDEAFRRQVEAFQQHLGGPERNRYFQRMFESLMAAWVRGDLQAAGVESFEAFHARVTQAFAAVTEAGGSGRVVVFTSGGPIGACVQTALGAPKTAAMTLNSRVKNCSLTEFVFSAGRLSLDFFNVTQFFDEALLSFR